MSKTISGNINDLINEDFEEDFAEMEKELESKNISETKSINKPPLRKSKKKNINEEEVKEQSLEEETIEYKDDVKVVETNNGIENNGYSINQRLQQQNRNATVEGYKAKFNEINDKIVVDLNNIQLSENINSLERNMNLDIIFNSRPAYQVKLSQSCYSAFMESLKMPEITSLINSTMDVYNSKLKLYQTIYNKIQTTSIGKFSFDAFLQITSFFDLPTLLYGIYMQTFPGSSPFDITCRNCKEKFETKVPNDALVYSNDTNIFERFEEIAKNAHTVDDVLAGSLVNKYERVLLEDSKTIVEIQTPSLKHHLDTLRPINPDKIQELSDNITRCLFVRDIYVLNVPATIQNGTPQYYKITEMADKFKIFDNLTVHDAQILGEAMENRMTKYEIGYKIKSFNCPKCGKPLGDINIDMETILFRQMLRL